MATLKERNGNYSIRFVQTKDGKKQVCQFSLKTKRKKIAEKLQRNLEIEQESGIIDVYNNFDFISWRDGTPSETPTSSKYLLSQSIEAFISDRTDMGPNSRKNYHQLLKAFNEHVGITMLTELVQKKDIQEYCFRKDISIATQNNYLTHLKVFFKWVEENSHGTNETIGIRMKTVPENLKEQILSKNELDAVLSVHKEYISKQEEKGYIFSDSKRQLWFEPLIRFAYKTGLRKTEIIKLKWAHVDLKNNLISVVAGKGGKSRTVLLDKELKPILSTWKKSVVYNNDRYVFESPESTSNSSKPLGKATPSKNFKKFVVDAGLSDSIHFHSLRHTAATNYLKAGYNLFEVQKLMGHSSVSVTERYLHLVPNDLREKAERLGLI
tara:strand:+ start:60038 stop:61180 length:1143 start_codon:yes stop_codon:yes gene_type:complete